ncbi:MAG: NAD(P)-dependent oxidoreductase [Burkholderiales bacterium]|nr:NAD(P)-dependent oxidoreductase [Burkholderiales bacterium]
MEHIGFVGLGVMGQPMALNLLRAGYALTVYNRTAARAALLAQAGASVAVSPRAVAAVCRIVCVNVADDAAVEAVLFGAEGLAPALRADDVVIDLGTTSPAATRAYARRLAQQGVNLIDAPVSGGEAGARAGTLSIMAGGPKAAFERVLPLLKVLGSNVVHVGEANGSGQVAKACNQIAVSATLLGVAEALTFARRQGVDAAQVRAALLGGFAYSRILEVHGERMLTRAFAPGFRARLHQKDLGLVLAEAQALGLPLPVTALAAQLMHALNAMGGAEQDSSAVVQVVETLAGLDPRPNSPTNPL